MSSSSPVNRSSTDKIRFWPFSMNMLRTKICFFCAIAVLAQAIFVIVVLKQYSGIGIYQRMPSMVTHKANLAKTVVTKSILSGNDKLLKEDLASLIKSSLVKDVMVIDCAGLFHTRGAESDTSINAAQPLTDLPPDLYTRMQETGKIETAASLSSRTLMYAIAPVPCPKPLKNGSATTLADQSTKGALIIKYDFTQPIRREVRLSYFIGFGQLIVSIVLLCIGGVLLLRYLTTKLAVLSRSMNDFSPANPTNRYDVKNADEIDEIGQSFNNMADTIQLQLVKIQNSNRRLVLTDKIFELSSSGVVILSSDFIILDANPAFIDINGYQLHEVVGKHFDFLSHDMPDSERALVFEEARETGSAKRDFWMRAATGKRFRKSIRLSPVANDDGNVTHYFVIENDITEEYMQRLQMQTLATTDSLTGLKNRRQYERDATNIILSESGGIAIACIDLDGLKEINTKYGHLAGDQLIETAGRRLLEQVESLALGIYRLGGDEFCAILNNPGNIDELTRICRALIAAVEGAVNVEMVTTDLTIGLGVSLYDSTRHTSIEDVMRDADIALKEAKRAGRSSFVMAREETLWGHERRINISLGLKSQQLSEQVQVAYLPKVDIQNNILSGAEALIRWTSPDLGFVRNDEFIPIAEETGDILKIDEWVMRRAIADAVTFGDLIDGFQTTVNVSPRQLFESYYSQDLIHQLKSNNVDAENFSVEITEWTAIQSHERFIPVINALRTAGISVELDDFGTGHSSLVNLHRLPVDALKIDRSFVDKMVESRVSLEIVRSIIMLSHSLKMTVIAEGVENVTQLELLRELGCDYCQGYLYSEPVIVEDDNSLKNAIAQWQETIDGLC